ncbi:hypothetical protein AOLI_G00035080 [Acnodon oligacanthus]
MKKQGALLGASISPQINAKPDRAQKAPERAGHWPALLLLSSSLEIGCDAPAFLSDLKGSISVGMGVTLTSISLYQRTGLSALHKSASKKRGACNAALGVSALLIHPR